MPQQPEITNFFKHKGKMSQEVSPDIKSRKRTLLLNRSSSKSPRLDGQTNVQCVSLLSSSDDSDFENTPAFKKKTPELKTKSTLKVKKSAKRNNLGTPLKYDSGNTPTHGSPISSHHNKPENPKKGNRMLPRKNNKQSSKASTLATPLKYGNKNNGNTSTDDSSVSTQLNSSQKNCPAERLGMNCGPSQRNSPQTLPSNNTLAKTLSTSMETLETESFTERNNFPTQDNNVVVLEDSPTLLEDDFVNIENVCTPPRSHHRSSSESTLIYSPFTPVTHTKMNDSSPSPSKNGECLTSANQTNINKLSTSSTPSISKTSPKSSNSNSHKKTPHSPFVSPSKKTKFYSPTKKKTVKNHSPTKIVRNLASEFESTTELPIMVQSPYDNIFNQACTGQDDKTIFLLQNIYDFLKDKSMHYLLKDEERLLLDECLQLPQDAMKIVCRLYWRKDCWYRSGKLLEIVNGKQRVEANGERSSIEILKCLHLKGILNKAIPNNMSVEDYTTGLLKVDEVKEICKHFKIKMNNKKDAVESLQTFCRRTSDISSYFMQNKGTSDNKRRVLEKMSEYAGDCYKMSETARSILSKLYLLTYMGIDYTVIREGKLEFMLIHDKIGKECYPIDKSMQIDKANIIFETREEFESYWIAHCIYEDFIQSEKEIHKRCSIVQQAYALYLDLTEAQLERFKCLPSWLRRFTPGNIYIKIIESGIKDLKATKDKGRYESAVTMLTTLMSQDCFRRHRYMEWCNEKSLILQKYLKLPIVAAQVLIQGLTMDISEEFKDILRPRAKKLANCSKIELDSNTKAVLLAAGTKEKILEHSMKSVSFYKQAMDNVTKGKARFETKTEDGVVVRYVEPFAIMSYINQGEYTNGQHWEGRIITTIFYLIFWDIIYSKPANVKGIFMSHYQRFPLDMFCDDFYHTRQLQIDSKLKLVETSNIDQVVEIMQITWENRPLGELSGINRDIEWDHIREVAECLGPRRLAALCARLARNYRYTHSGFPDLTLWNPLTRMIKFVEVKSDNDKASMKQIQWMQYLAAHNIDTEFCYVGTKHTHDVVRRSAVKIIVESQDTDTCDES